MRVRSDGRLPPTGQCLCSGDLSETEMTDPVGDPNVYSRGSRIDALTACSSATDPALTALQRPFERGKRKSATPIYLEMFVAF